MKVINKKNCLAIAVLNWRTFFEVLQSQCWDFVSSPGGRKKELMHTLYKTLCTAELFGL